MSICCGLSNNYLLKEKPLIGGIHCWTDGLALEVPPQIDLRAATSQCLLSLREDGINMMLHEEIIMIRSKSQVAEWRFAFLLPWLDNYISGAKLASEISEIQLSSSHCHIAQLVVRVQ